MTQEELKLSLERHITRIERIIEKRKTLSNKYSKIRLSYFVIAVAGIYFSYGMIPDWAYLFSLFALITGFIILIDRHRRVYQSQEKFEHLRGIKKEHIARMKLDWDHIGYRPIEVETKNHPFASDLDILGKHSLFHLTDTSMYEASGQKLAHWFLSAAPSKEEVLRRQQQVKELVPLTGFRDKLRVIGLFTRLHSMQKDWSIEDMLKWLRLPEKKGIKIPLAILSVLSISNFILAVLLLNGFSTSLPLVICWFIYMVYYKLNDQKILHLFDSAYQIEIKLNQFKSILFHVEKFVPNKGSELEKLLSVYQDETERPSLFIKKNQRTLSRASLKANRIMWGVVNFMVPWDLYYLMRVEKLKKILEPKLTKWLDVFYELEALNSLANFAMLNPGFVWPEFEDRDKILFKSIGLGHPLIPSNKRIANSFEVQKGKDLFLITGSNMAGKSTFLRTVGINLVLAYTGAPVCASALNTQFFRVFTSINITDSLDDGLSHFYTEVKRLRFLLDELLKEDELPLFFFVDEIYRGTNNRERYAGSAAFLKEVAGKNGVGLVSSHDLELADLEQEIPQLSNWHFVESIENGKMSFEYKLRSGPCPSTNALEIMRMEGLPT
ncbi:MAG: MutS family DNA mismatch repair protein [Balneola sp.]